MATNWTLDGYRMKVNGQPFFAKGVSYSPVPWGTCPSFEPFGDFMIDTWSSIWERDVALMRENNVNLLKTYNTLDIPQLKRAGLPITRDHSHKGFLTACWNDGDRPVYVLMGYAPPKNDMKIFYQDTWNQKANVDARTAMQADLVALAKDYGGFDAVMGFVLANEINAGNVRANPDFYVYWNGVANAIAAVAPGKLTLLANVDDSMQTVQYGAAGMTATNFFWGYNSYRGNWTNSNGFDNLFSTYATTMKSNKRPLMLTEWGNHNSTHDKDGQIIPATPAQMANLITYVTGHYSNMLDNRSDIGDGGVCCGGTYFAWSNELWKADPEGFECNQPNAAPACHTQVWDPGPNMTFRDNIPGGYADEEAWGLFSIAPVDPKNRVPVVAGGCTGPWNPRANAPYPPDTFTLLDHGRALFKAFDDNLYVVNYGKGTLTKYVGPQDRNKDPALKVTVGPASFKTVAPQQVTGGPPPWQVTEHLTGPYLSDTNVTKLPAVIAFEPNCLTAVVY